MPALVIPVRFKRGAEAGIPTGLSGEPLWTTDTHKLFVSDGASRHLIGYPTYEATNSEGASITQGMVVAVHGSGSGVIKASAADATKPASGLAMATVADTFSATIQTSGPFTLADWTAVTGSVTLSAHAVYFLDPATPGLLTTTVPSGSGEVVQEVGVAVSTVTLNISIEYPILL